MTISGNSLHFYARADFWYETTFTLPAGSDPRQLHATIIKNSWPEEEDIGTVVVTLFKIEDGTLTLGVIDDFERPPASPVVGDWDRAMDVYHLERAQPQATEKEREEPRRGTPIESASLVV